MRAVFRAKMVHAYRHATADIMYMAQVANKIPQQTADRMGIHATKPMQRQHARAVHVFIPAFPDIVTVN